MEKKTSGARRRSALLALAALAVAALCLALGAGLGLAAPAVAIDVCLALALLGALAYAAAGSGLAARYSSATLVAAQLTGAFLVLAWLSYRAGDTFAMTAGCRHTEQCGAEGVRYLAGRRYPQKAAG